MLINFKEADSQARDFDVLVDGTSATILERSAFTDFDGQNLVMLKVNVISPDMHKDGPSLFPPYAPSRFNVTIGGLSRVFNFAWRQACHYPTFCSRFGLIVNPDRSADVGSQPWNCDQAACSLPEDLELPRLLSSASMRVSTEGGDVIMIALSNIVSDNPLVRLGSHKMTSVTFNWMAYTNISISVPELQDPPCNACGRLCKCTVLLQIFDSAEYDSSESALDRKVSVELHYISPIIGPPVLLGYSFGCVVKPCAGGTIYAGQSVDIKVTLGNFPEISRPFVKCLISGPQCLGVNGYVSDVLTSVTVGSMKSISVLSSDSLETKLILTFTAPSQVPVDGYVTLFIFQHTSSKTHLYLPVLRVRAPQISNVFPTAMSRYEALSRSITIKVLNWVAGKTRISDTSVTCPESKCATTGTARVVSVDAVRHLAELWFSFTSPDRLPQCEYEVALLLADDSDAWNTPLRISVNDTSAIVSIAPSHASMLGGSGMHLVLSNFPAVHSAADVQVVFIDQHGTARPAADVALLWSSAGDRNQSWSTGLLIRSPSALRPGMEELKVLHSNGDCLRGFVQFESEPIETPDMVPIKGGVPVSLNLLSFPADEAAFQVEVFLAQEGLVQKQLVAHTLERHNNKVVIQFTAPSASRAGRKDGEIGFVNKSTMRQDLLWRFQAFSLHYYSYPSASISPSRANTQGGTIATIRVQDAFFPAWQVRELPLVLFDHAAARVSSMLGGDVIELQIEVPEYPSANLIGVSVIFGSMIVDGLEYAAATAVTSFEYFAPIPRVMSVVPSKWKVKGETSVRLALKHFPNVQSSADISVIVGDTSALVKNILFSGESETLLTIDVPAVGIENQFGTVSWAGVTAVFPFKVYDTRASITCQREADNLGCLGAVSGGDHLVVSINLGPITFTGHLFISFGALSAPDVQILETNSSSTKLRVRVPNAVEQISTTTSLDLVVINNQIDDVQAKIAAAVIEFKYAVAPSLLRAVLDPDGSGVQLLFDQDTNQLNLHLRSWQCNALFEASTLSVFGVDPKCSWIDRKTLQVRFGFPGSQPCLEGTAILVKQGIIKDVDDLTPLQQDSKRMALLEFHPLIHLGLQVSGIMTVGPCDDAIVRALTTFWGDLVYEWSCASCDCFGVGPSLALCLELASLTSDTLHLPSRLLPEAGEHKFRLSVSSPVGITSAQIEFSIFRSTVPLPLLSLVGPTTTSSGKDFRISAIVGLPRGEGSWDLASCMSDTASQKLSFEWRQVDQGNTDRLIPERSLLQNSGFLILKAAEVALIPGSYKIELRLSSGTHAQSVSSEFSFTVLRSNLVAHIEGPRHRVISHQDPFFSLNGLLSYDPDPSAAPLSYKWSCRDELGFECRHKDTRKPIVLATTPTIPVLAGTLGAGKSFSFAVEVSKDSRMSTDSVSVTVVSHYVLRLAIDSPGAKVLNNQFWINADQRIILRANCTSCSRVLWSVDGQTIPGDLGAAKSLAIRGRDLLPGKTYEYSITSFAPAPVGFTCVGDGGHCRGSASIHIRVNPPPTSGQCIVSIPNGAPTEMDVFFGRCSGFCDEHQPLRYTFGYLIGSSQFLTSSSELSSASMYLPAAKNVLVFAIVQDSLGSSRRFEIQSITAYPSTLGAVSTISIMKTLVMLGRSEFHSFAIMLSLKLDRLAQERRRQSSGAQNAVRSTRASLEEEETMIRNNLIFMLADVFSSESPTTENALQTIGPLAALIKDSNVGADAALLGASVFVSASEILRNELPSLAGDSSNAENSQRMVTCAARLTSNIRLLLPGTATEELIERQMRPTLDVAADLAMLDAVVGEQSMMCSSATNSWCMQPLSQTAGAIRTTSAALSATALASFQFHGPAGMMNITLPNGALYALADGTLVAESSKMVLHNQLWQDVSWGVLHNAPGARLEPLSES